MKPQETIYRQTFFFFFFGSIDIGTKKIMRDFSIKKEKKEVEKVSNERMY